MATTLEVRDMLVERDVVTEWKIPTQLKVCIPSLQFIIESALIVTVMQFNIKLYSLAFLLSPLIKSYRGKAAESVLVCNPSASMIA